MKRGLSVLLLVSLFAISFACAQINSKYSQTISTQTDDVIILPERKDSNFTAFIAVAIVIAIVVIVYLKRRNTKRKKKGTVSQPKKKVKRKKSKSKK